MRVVRVYMGTDILPVPCGSTILKAEVTRKGSNPRFVVTNLEGDAQHIYDKTYCGRGEMENRIKEQQLGLFSDRTSAHRWWANQFRVLLSAAAYVLMETMRRVALEGTELARAQVGTIRLKLLKIGAVIVRNTRRIRVMLSSAYPYQGLFAQVAFALRVKHWGQTCAGEDGAQAGESPVCRVGCMRQ